MKELTNIWEVPERLQEEESKPLLVLISSTECPWCTAFAPAYQEIADRMVYHYDACFIKAEAVGGRKALREEFFKCFGKNYNGFPTLYIATSDGSLHEVEQKVLWNGAERKWNIKGALKYMRDYSYITIKGVKK